jgi:hypothetical protein
MVFWSKNLYIKYTILFVYILFMYSHIKYIFCVFTYALGNKNFAEYVVQSFILSRKTYVNKIIGSFCLLLFIYLVGIHWNYSVIFGVHEITRRKIVRAPEHELVFLKFLQYVFLSLNFFLPSNTQLNIYVRKRTPRNFVSKYHVFWEIQKDKFLTNNTYFGSINCYIFFFFIGQNKMSFLRKICTCILTIYMYFLK